MALVQWSDLPSGIVWLIAELAESDIDLLRLRSVCSSWRSSLSPPPQKKPFSFPLKVPSVHNPSEMSCLNRNKHCNKAKHCSYNLHENTLYRLSSPIDPSVGWMFKASVTNPNTFSLLIPLSTSAKLRPPPYTIPKHINLLDYQISEISKSYRLQGPNCDGVPKDLIAFAAAKIIAFAAAKKLITLFNYVVDCDFVVLALEYQGKMSYWKIGDVNWTPIDTNGHYIEDVIFYNKRCYAIDREGVLVVLDSKLQLTPVVASSLGGNKHSLLECDSDLYVASRTFGVGPGIARWYLKKLTLSKLNKCNGKWDRVEDLGDKVFVFGKDVSVGVSAKDFEGCKGNCVYLSEFVYGDGEKREVCGNESEIYGDTAIIYYLDKNVAVKMEEDEESRKLYWPPPSWLLPDARSSDL